MPKIKKKYIEDLVLQEIKCFRSNKEEQIASDYWLISLFDEVHNKIREGGI